MSTISQRELRNDNAEVIRRVQEGESLVITRHGVPVARLTAYEPDSDLKRARPAKRRISYQTLERIRLSANEPPAGEVLDDLRGDR